MNLHIYINMQQYTIHYSMLCDNHCHLERCLEKNADNRPFMVELIEHPFFTELIGPTGSDHHVNTSLYISYY